MVRFAALAVLVALLLLLLTFALPVSVWRTGELPPRPLDLLPAETPRHLSPTASPGR